MAGGSLTRDSRPGSCIAHRSICGGNSDGHCLKREAPPAAGGKQKSRIVPEAPRNTTAVFVETAETEDAAATELAQPSNQGGSELHEYRFQTSNLYLQLPALTRVRGQLALDSCERSRDRVGRGGSANSIRNGWHAL